MAKDTFNWKVGNSKLIKYSSYKLWIARAKKHGYKIYFRPSGKRGYTLMEVTAKLNPEDTEAAAAAAEVYKEIHWGDETDETIKAEYDVPETMVAIGALVAVEYETHKGGEKAIWRHVFKKRSMPILCTNIEGDQLYIVGGDYEIKEEGITG